MAGNAPGRVLPTLNEDGTRRWIRPRRSPGRYWTRRAVIGWALIALFVAVPFIKVGGYPVILLDVPARQFHLFGRTFLATDGVLLMLLMLSIFVGVFWLTAMLGRVWCGYACPQTVYMELLFRPIEQWIEGGRAGQLKLDKNGGGSRRMLKFAIFGLLSVFVANVFLAYFVGVERLGLWVAQGPIAHPTGFLVMAVTAGLVFFDFGYFREQMCTVACPYARFQSVLLDKDSLVVGYDEKRGEPRGKKGKTTGDCVDCGACVVTCPTGIDIRNGLQLECIACAQCVDACDTVMDKLERPRGLIRYASQRTLGGEAKKLLRPRAFAYPLVMTLLVGLLVFAGGRTTKADVTVLRGLSAPFVVDQSGVRNQIRIKVQNRGNDDRTYNIELLDANGAKLIAPENPLQVKSGERRETTVFVLAPKEMFTDGKRAVEFRVSDGQGFDRTLPYKLLGPGGEK
ncbi:MAG: cytochrome c oxidase accessory protein CcoG [Myxococcales bacterium]|nr:cytochrome c oxidase accessory protein CcoG [Myxococcales bacterium]